MTNQEIKKLEKAIRENYTVDPSGVICVRNERPLLSAEQITEILKEKEIWKRKRMTADMIEKGISKQKEKLAEELEEITQGLRKEEIREYLEKGEKTGCDKYETNPVVVTRSERNGRTTYEEVRLETLAEEQTAGEPLTVLPKGWHMTDSGETEFTISDNREWTLNLTILKSRVKVRTEITYRETGDTQTTGLTIVTTDGKTGRELRKEIKRDGGERNIYQGENDIQRMISLSNEIRKEGNINNLEENTYETEEQIKEMSKGITYHVTSQETYGEEFERDEYGFKKGALIWKEDDLETEKGTFGYRFDNRGEADEYVEGRMELMAKMEQKYARMAKTERKDKEDRTTRTEYKTIATDSIYQKVKEDMTKNKCKGTLINARTGKTEWKENGKTQLWTTKIQNKDMKTTETTKQKNITERDLERGTDAVKYQKKMMENQERNIKAMEQAIRETKEPMQLSAPEGETWKVERAVMYKDGSEWKLDPSFEMTYEKEEARVESVEQCLSKEVIEGERQNLEEALKAVAVTLTDKEGKQVCTILYTNDKAESDLLTESDIHVNCQSGEVTAVSERAETALAREGITAEIILIKDEVQLEEMLKKHGCETYRGLSDKLWTEYGVQTEMTEEMLSKMIEKENNKIKQGKEERKETETKGKNQKTSHRRGIGI